MKNILSIMLLMLSHMYVYTQCTPDSYYQDSTYGIWPDTIDNLPVCIQNSPYNEELTIKTPATLIEASGGDSSFTQLDTTILVTPYSFQLADWPVDSMSLVSIDGLPNGLMLSCENSSCVLPGNTLTCAVVTGSTPDPLGVYPITIWVDVYTHGVLDLGLIQYPLSTSLFEATGSYESLNGYKIIISNSSSYELVNSDEFTLFQNIPNPSNGNTTIRFNLPISQNVSFLVTDVFGRPVLSRDIDGHSGVNSISISEDIPAGIYTYSIINSCLLYTSPSPRDGLLSRMPSSA